MEIRDGRLERGEEMMAKEKIGKDKEKERTTHIC